MSDNLCLYRQGAAVPDEAKKPIAAGRLKGMTDINPMWRIKRLTEMFGPCGVGWWYEITDKHIVTDEISKQAAAFVDIRLYYIDAESGAASHGIPGTGGASFVAQERSGAYLSDECYKMALTDAISVAAKALGIGADVYYAKDRDKYTAPEGQDSSAVRPQNDRGGNRPQDDRKEEGESPRPEDKTSGEAGDKAATGKADLGFYCARCGKRIVSYINSAGEPVGVRKHCEGSKAKFGGIYCLDCITSGEAMKE